MLRQFLAGRDAPCPACSYNLRGLTTDRCPECNQPLTLQVALTEPKLASFVAGIVGLSCGPGFCAVVLVWAIINATVGRGGPSDRDFVPLVCGVLYGAVTIPVWNARRRHFLAASAQSRWALVGVAGLAGLAFAVWFFIVAG
jgi:hypothetical protein